MISESLFARARALLARGVRGRRAAVAALVTAAALAAGCAEQLDSGAACPALCPLQNEAVRDTLLTDVVFDTTLAGYPAPGESGRLLLAVAPAPDSVDVRAVVRFDALPARYFPPTGGDSLAITAVDSGFVRLRLDTTATRFTQPITVEAYDVDTSAAADTTSAALAALFRPDRLLGAVSVEPGALRDTLRVPVDNGVIAAKAQGSRRLRVGLRVRSAAAAQLRLVSASSGALASQLSFDPVPGETYAPRVLEPSSATPDVPTLTAAFRDFAVVAHAARAAEGTDLVVGGVPGRRVALSFVVPARIVDSTTIVRATLELVQQPAAGALALDSVTLRPAAVVASALVTDLRRAIDLAAGAAVFGLDTLRTSPAASGTRTLSIVNAVRAWRFQPAGTRRILVLRADLEGAQTGELRFYSVEAPSAELRPRLRLSYIPRTDFGLP